MKYITLSWDDGLQESSRKILDMFNRYNLKAEFNVVANYTLTNRNGVFPDFEFWSDVMRQGHIVQPHGYEHNNFTQMPYDQAISEIEKSIEIFSNYLYGFSMKDMIYTLPFNASNKALEEYFYTNNIRFRTHGSYINNLPTKNTLKLTTNGGQNAEELFDIYLSELYKVKEGWLFYNVHGLDGEGFGPMRASFVEEKLKEILDRDDIELLPAIEVIKR